MKIISCLKKSRLLFGLSVISILFGTASSSCNTLAVKGYVPESWRLVNTKLTTTCGKDEKEILPLERPVDSPSCNECRSILIIKQIQGNALPTASFEYYNATTVLYLENLGIETISPGAFESMERLKELHLKGNKLRSMLVGVLSSVESLEILDLSANQIHSMKEVSLDGTKQISSVNLSSNFLTVVETDEAWSNISNLDLSMNKITEVDFRVLPPKLSVLNISLNALTAFDVHKNFTVLDLGGNSLSTFDFKWINYTMNILSLRNNRITNVLGTYCRIKEVDLSGNKLSSVPCDCSNNSPQVERLNLAKNVISDVIPQTISEVNNLKEIRLDYNKIKTVKSGTFAGLQKLTYLNISHNDIENFEIGSVDNVKNVEVFDVSYNKLTQLKRYIMHNFANLKHLNLEYNNITYINGTNLNDDLPKIWDINIVGNNLTCNNLWEILRIFNKRPVHFPSGPFKNVSNVHGMPCYLAGNSTEDDFGASLDELEINKGIADYFNHDYRQSNFYKFLQEVQDSNLLVYNETRKITQQLKEMFHPHKKSEPLIANSNGELNGYLITVVLFLLVITSFIGLQVFVLYNKFRTRTNDAERLL